MKRKVISWMNPKLIIRKNRFGKGIFAKKELKKNETLFVMSGYILTSKDDNKIGKKAAEYEIDISPDFSFGILEESQKDLLPHFYLNHSCNPNAGLKDQIFIVSMRRIKKNEEIVYDYATVSHRNRKNKNHFRMKCSCNSKDCRGIVTENDWRLPKLQKKYNGYFQLFIQDKINKKEIK